MVGAEQKPEWAWVWRNPRPRKHEAKDATN